MSVKDGTGHVPGRRPRSGAVLCGREGSDGDRFSAPLESDLVGFANGLGGLYRDGVVSMAGPRGRPRETSDFLSHDKGRRAFHLLPGGRAERRADAPLAARISFVIADVRAAFCPAFRPLSLTGA